MSNKNTRTLSLYGPYDAGLFGHHLTDDQVVEHGLRMKGFNELRERFGGMCDTLGERALAYLGEGNLTITPQPVNTDHALYMSRVLGLEGSSVILDVGGVGANDIAEEVINKGGAMDSIRKWVDLGGVPVLSPRTTTPGSIVLAQELGINHWARLPDEKYSRQIRGVFPSLKYIENNPSSKNNSKVLNFQLLKDLDSELGTSFSPEGDVAFDIKTTVKIVDNLARSGLEVMIKADLSVDGMGNLKLDFDNLKIEGKRYLNCNPEEKEAILRRELKKHGIPIGSQMGVVVSEFLRDKVTDPSIEIYTLPLELGQDPFVYYSCEMLIERGGFAGSIIPDHMQVVDPQEHEEYIRVMKEVEKVSLAFAKIRQLDGYVGINDCDIAICRDSESGKLYAKIVEFNYNRETGGTATYHMKKKLDSLSRGNGVVIARDSIRGERYAMPIGGIVEELNRHSLGYTSNLGKGAVVLGHRPETSNIMSLVYAPTLPDALNIDKMLHE